MIGTICNQIIKFSCLALTLVIFDGLRGEAQASDTFSFSEMQIRATASGMQSSAVYLEIANIGPVDDRLIAVTTAIAQRAEIHLMEMVGSVMRMRVSESGLAIDAGDSVTLAPGGWHIMLMGLTTDLAVGSKHAVTLVFEKAGHVTLIATAKLPSEIKMTMPGYTASHDHNTSKSSQ